MAEITTAQIHVTVSLPVQCRFIGRTPFDIKVAGLSSIFDNMPESVKSDILVQLVESVNEAP